MRRVLYILILAVLFFAPLQRVDVAELLPINAVALYMDGGMVTVETDTGHLGTGETVQLALESLQKDTPAVVYLDTAEYLMISSEIVAQSETLRQWLKPSVKVCVCDVRGRVKEAAQYLDVHGNLPKLKEWKGENYTG